MRLRTAPFAMLLPLALLLGSADAAAGDGPVTIYRCTDGKGKLALRDSPCLSGEQQQTVSMQRPQDPPPKPQPLADATPTSAVARAPETRIVVVDRPHAMYECVTEDGARYTSEDPQGNLRWVPLWTLGYPVYNGYRPPWRGDDGRGRPDRPTVPSSRGYTDNGLVFDGIGRPAPRPPSDGPAPPRRPPAIGLAQTPGTWIRDRCVQLPQAEVCSRLRDRRFELGRDYNSALQSERRQIDLEQRQIDERLASDC